MSETRHFRRWPRLAGIVALACAFAATAAFPDDKPAGARPAMDITYLVADAVNFGSTAFKISEKDLVIYIEAFPAKAACKLDPETIKKADLIIENVHGHKSHYDPDVCALVAKNTGAFVLGNAQLKADMLARKVAPEKIIELSPGFGEKRSTKIDALNITVTAYGMAHTMMPQLKVDTYLVEMPDGIRWYHGTCSSGPPTMKWMDKYPELKGVDVMFADCDMNFDALREKFQPRVLIKDHDFQCKFRPSPATVFTFDPAGTKLLSHNNSYSYTQPEKTP